MKSVISRNPHIASEGLYIIVGHGWLMVEPLTLEWKVAIWRDGYNGWMGQVGAQAFLGVVHHRVTVIWNIPGFTAARVGIYVQVKLWPHVWVHVVVVNVDIFIPVSSCVSVVEANFMHHSCTMLRGMVHSLDGDNFTAE